MTTERVAKVSPVSLSCAQTKKPGKIKRSSRSDGQILFFIEMVFIENDIYNLKNFSKEQQ
jgi:hypothetical protein